MSRLRRLTTPMLAYKGLHIGNTMPLLALVRIPRGARVVDFSHKAGGKMRVERVVTVAIFDTNGKPWVEGFSPFNSTKACYAVGKTTRPGSFDPSDFQQCGQGLHVVTTPAKAMGWAMGWAMGYCGGNTYTVPAALRKALKAARVREEARLA